MLFKALLTKNFLLMYNVFVSKKKCHVHVAFKIPISEYESFDKLMDSQILFRRSGEREKNIFYDYKIIYP